VKAGAVIVTVLMQLCMRVHTYFHSHIFPLLCFLYKKAFDEQCSVSQFVVFGWNSTSSCLHASIECVRQSVI
jgi:hypothetical protein